MRRNSWLLVLAAAIGFGCSAQDKNAPNPNPTGISQLTISPVTVNFRHSLGGPNPVPQTVSLGGTPGVVDGLLVGTILYNPISSGWLQANLSSTLTNTPIDVVLSPIIPADLTAGSYVGIVPVGSTVNGVQTQYIVATLTVDSIPVLDLSPRTVTISAQQAGADPAPQFVSLDNAGSGVLSGLFLGTITYGTGASGWLSATLNQSTAPSTITLQATTGTLPIGTYVAQVPIGSSLTGVAGDTLTVSFGVSSLASPPGIVPSPTVLQINATVGGSNPLPQPVRISNGGGGSLTGLAVGAITYGAGASGWLNASINQTFAPADVTLQADVGSLVAGTYSATVAVASTQPGVAPASFIVDFTLGSGPQSPLINLAPSQPTFTANTGGSSPTPVTVNVTNGGGGTLSLLSLGTITYGVGASGWLGATLSNTTAPATVTLTPTLGALSVGTYTATVPVNSGVIGVAGKVIQVTFQVVGPPVPAMIGLSRTTVNFTATAGAASPSPKTLTVTNSGAGTLTGLAVGTITYGAGQPTGWLSGALNQATAPATLTLAPSTTSLAPGTYRATVPVTSVVAGNSPRNVTVNLTVSGSASLALTPSSVFLTGTSGLPNPAPATVSVSNGGSGTLTGLAAGPVSYAAGQPTGWLATTLSGTTSPATLVLSATIGSLPPGTFTATVPVTTTTAGVASQSVTVSFAIGNSSGSFVILQGDNQSGLVGTQLPITLKARVYDGAGNPKPNVNVAWQVNNGGTLLNTTTVTAPTSGEVSTNWKLGPLAGLHTVTVSSAGLPTLTFTADVLLPPNPTAHPNEPAGFTVFAEHNLSSVPSPSRSVLGALVGSWYAVTSSNLAVVTPDLTAPESPPNVMKVHFPTGLIAGRAPVEFAGWDIAGKTNGQKSKIYFSTWIKIDSLDYENQAVGTKFGFFGAATPTSQTANNSWFFLKGSGVQAIQSAIKVELHQQNPNRFDWPQNVDQRALMTGQVWHHWEAVFELNTLGASDGIFRWWIDGIKVMDRTDMVYIYPGNTNKFFEYVFNPTWGGVGGTRTRNDYVRIDHIYISGVP